MIGAIMARTEGNANIFVLEVHSNDMNVRDGGGGTLLLLLPLRSLGLILVTRLL